LPIVSLIFASGHKSLTPASADQIPAKMMGRLLDDGDSARGWPLGGDCGLCEKPPLTFQAIVIWRDGLNDGSIFSGATITDVDPALRRFPWNRTVTRYYHITARKGSCARGKKHHEPWHLWGVALIEVKPSVGCRAEKKYCRHSSPFAPNDDLP